MQFLAVEEIFSSWGTWSTAASSDNGQLKKVAPSGEFILVVEGDVQKRGYWTSHRIAGYFTIW